MDKNFINTQPPSQVPEFLLQEQKKLLSLPILEDDYILELKNVSKIYENGFPALFNTNIKLKKGDFLVFLGPSGCGKTTTLRIIAGLEQINQGEVYISNINVTHAEPAQRNLAMVFQNYALFPHLTVWKNIAFGLRANKKKLGLGGIVYKEINNCQNRLIYLQTKIQDINLIEANKNKLKKFKQKSRKYQLQIENNSSNVKLVKKLKNKIITIQSFIDIEQNKIFKSEQDQINFRKIEKEIKEIKQKIDQLNHKRNELVKNDNYKEIIKHKVFDVAKILGLEYHLNKKPALLSGGQRQRVALGRSIVSNPTLFLMDEPLSNLDAQLRSTMRYKIRELHQLINSGTIYVTHDQIEAMTMADQIAVMQDGFIMQIGSPEEIYQNPSCLFVASFVGSPSINLLKGTYQAQQFISEEGLKINLPAVKTSQLVNGQKIVLGIRPHDVLTKVNFSIKNNNNLEAQIFYKELLGNEIQYRAKIKSQNNYVKEIEFITSSYENYALQETITLSFMDERIHIFDQNSTIALSSEFNLDTVNALIHWIQAEEKINLRKEFLAKAQKAQQAWTRYLWTFMKISCKKCFTHFREKSKLKSHD